MADDTPTPTPQIITPKASDSDWREISVDTSDGIPGYVFLEQGTVREEARRIYAINLLLDSNKNLAPNWRTEVAGLEAYLRDGILPSNTVPIKVAA